MFVVENIYYLIYKNKRFNILATSILFLLAVINSTFNPVRLPFCIDISLVAILFYRLGSVLREKGDKIFNPYLFVLSVIVTVLVFVLNGKVAMHTDYYNNIFLFVAGGVAGCYMMSYLCKMLQSLFGERTFVQNIARNTLLICALHLVVFAFLKGIMLYVFKIEPSVLNGTILLNALFALLSLAICLVAAKIMEKLKIKVF